MASDMNQEDHVPDYPQIGLLCGCLALFVPPLLLSLAFLGIWWIIAGHFPPLGEAFGAAIVLLPLMFIAWAVKGAKQWTSMASKLNERWNGRSKRDAAGKSP